MGETRRLVLEGLEAGRSVAAIARDLGVSRQAVYLHVAQLRADGLLPPSA